MQISFTIPGRLKGKGRHRARALSVRGKTFVQTYADPKTVSAEAMLRAFGGEAMGSRPPLQGPLVLDVLVTLNTTKSWSKKRKAEAAYVTGKPDCDNIIKLIGDALNHVCWSDDSQICKIAFERRYRDNEAERVEIKIYRPVATADEFVARCETPLFRGAAA